MWKSLMQRREDALARKGEPVKAVEEFEWGLGCLGLEEDSRGPRQVIEGYIATAMANSDEFYAEPTVSDFTLKGDVLSFTSPVETEIPENNTAFGRLFETRSRDHIVLLIPHWNAHGDSYDKLAGVLRWFGFPCLRLSMPYHDARRPPNMPFASHMVSANIGRTIRSIRQAVQETRAAMSWLEGRGYRTFAAMGTSIGSSVASILSAHDDRLGKVFLAHMASSFGAVVWSGQATRHIRTALEPVMHLDDIRALWKVISPATYAQKLDRPAVRHAILSGRHDRVFLPELTQELVDAYDGAGVAYEWRTLNCGHYTIGMAPYKYWMLYYLVRFLRRNLGT